MMHWPPRLTANDWKGHAMMYHGPIDLKMAHHRLCRILRKENLKFRNSDERFPLPKSLLIIISKEKHPPQPHPPPRSLEFYISLMSTPPSPSTQPLLHLIPWEAESGISRHSSFSSKGGGGGVFSPKNYCFCIRSRLWNKMEHKSFNGYFLFIVEIEL